MKVLTRFVTALVLAVPVLAKAQADTAFSVPIEVKSQGVTLRATMHVAAGAGPHATLVSTKGFPGNNSQAFSTFLQSRGFNAISMNFRGQQQSDGMYDVAGTPADAAAIIAFLRSDSARRAFRIDPKRIAISGTSAGSFAALSAAADDESIGCLALIVPFNWTVLLVEMRKSPVTRSAVAAQAQSIMNSRVPPVRLDSTFATRTLDNAESYDLRGPAGRLKGRSVFMIGAAQDETAPVNTHFNPVRDLLRSVEAVVRDTMLDDTHNLPNSGDRVFDLIAAWLGTCAAR